MKLNRLFNRIMGKAQNEASMTDDDYEIVISSETPYATATEDYDGLKQVRTFTEPWEMQTDTMRQSASLPVKVLYDEENLLQLVLYLPDAVTNRNIRDIKPRQMVDIWLFLDNGEYFINFPEEIDPYFEEGLHFTRYRLDLGNTAFHSGLKDLRKGYSHQEVCDIVREKLSHANIGEIEVKILSEDHSAPECPLITVSTPTAPMLLKAFDAVTA